MKINWGTGIAIFIGIFLLSMAFFIYKSYQQKYPLVEEEYYPKGLEYDKQAERMKNAEMLPDKFNIVQAGNQIIVSQPSAPEFSGAEGTLLFYRPSDDAGDIVLPIKTDSSLKQVIDARILLPGKYIVKINWKGNGKEYYQEETIFVNH